MKFERLSEDKLKVTLSPECLKEYHIEITAMEPSSDEYQDLLRDVLEFASAEMGDEGLGKKIVVDGKEDANGNWVITITNVAKFTSADPHPKPMPAGCSDDGFDEIMEAIANLTDEEFATLIAHDYEMKYVDYDVFCFSKLEMLLEALSHCPGIRTSTSKLYYFKNAYCLVVKHVYKNHKAVYEFEAICSEFNGKKYCGALIMPCLIEHGKPIIKKAAISTLLKKFEV